MQGKAIIAVTGQLLQIQKKQDYACKKVCSVVKATKGKIFADWDEHPSMVNGVRLVVITSTYQVSTVHQRRWPLASVVGRWQAGHCPSRQVVGGGVILELEHLSTSSGMHPSLALPAGPAQASRLCLPDIHHNMDSDARLVAQDDRLTTGNTKPNPASSCLSRQLDMT